MYYNVLTFQSTIVEDIQENEDEVFWMHRQPTGIDLYFLGPDFHSFKVTVQHMPYYYIRVKKGYEREVEEYLRSMDPDEVMIAKIDLVEKKDLNAPGHLNFGTNDEYSKFLKIEFVNIQALVDIRTILLKHVQKNRLKRKQRGGTEDLIDPDSEDDEILREIFKSNDDIDQNFPVNEFRSKEINKKNDPTEYILDIREYDVHYHVRCSIDNDYRVGYWYSIDHDNGEWKIQKLEGDKYQERPDPVICAFDIETTKKRLMFPDHTDSIMMISYMIDGQGYLIVNREIVSADVDNFEYTPKPEYPGDFTVFNVLDEKSLLAKWFEHMKQAKPVIYTTFNGDYFDWPFIDARASEHGINMYEEIGFKKNGDVYESSFGVHMDCFYWVKRDSYLPQGSHGLKKVTAAKLGYKPIEIDPEDMVPFAKDQPIKLAQYSVSDAVATYYLYLKYVHPFIFSLCTLIPMPPDEVLRKGSGTLCESLLMVEAYKDHVIFPNRYQSDPEKMYKGHLLSSETYVGGHVESLRQGVYRNDLKQKFTLDSTAYQELIDTVDDIMKFNITFENKTPLSDIVNYDEVKEEIVQKLIKLRDTPNLEVFPKIYHLDVGAMYPNIILSNRLQPSAIVDETICASCMHNTSRSKCKRSLPWIYKSEVYASNRSEYNNLKRTIMNEKFPDPKNSSVLIPYIELPREKQNDLLKARISEYSRRAYGRTFVREQIQRKSTVCMRENPFYVDTVQRFRDRRYEYKMILKTWQNNLAKAEASGNADEKELCKKMIVTCDSLQVAHKCILNSFYGYVMRKGARWFSLEMAGIVTFTGAQIIKMARELVDRVGISLELDTDGIWCMLPTNFPENFFFTTSSGKKLRINFPCSVLNQRTHLHFTNHQYQTKNSSTFTISSRCEIFFEVDGPYRAMILPASKEEGKGIKKRYCIYNQDGSLAELKGFEIKRRGELELIKIMQANIFDRFLEGLTLEECYQKVGEQANHYLDVLFTKGSTVDDETLLGYISESSNMSKTLEEYGEGAKSARITTAKRLAELFGEKMIEQAGLKCTYIVSEFPKGVQVSQRCIPVIVFQMEKEDCLRYLRKWTENRNLNSTDVRGIIDWNYYIERIGGAVQKIISIPAALQGVPNPCPRIEHPKWLERTIANKNSTQKQAQITSMFAKKKKDTSNEDIEMQDIEDFGSITANPITKSQTVILKRKREDNENEFTGKTKELHMIYSDPKQALNDEFFESNDFPLWLQKQKNRWKKMRVERPFATTTKDNISSLFNARNEILRNNPWQIIEIRQIEPGIMKLFVQVQNSKIAESSKLFSILVNVPRRIYYNYKTEQQNREPMSLTLPRSQISPYLYELQLSEDVFQKSWNGIDSQDTNLLGIYETNVPSLFNALLQLGARCVVSSDSKKKVGTNSLSTDDLTRTVSVPYNAPSSMEKILFYTSFSDMRGIVALFFFETKIAEIFTIQQFQEKPKLQLHKMFETSLRDHIFRSEGSIPQNLEVPIYEFHHRYIEDREIAFKHIQKLLQEYKRQSTHSSIIIYHSSLSKDILCTDIPILNDYPLLTMANNYNSATFKFDWIQKTVSNFFEKLVSVDEWYNTLVRYATYTNIPLCNLEGDISMQIIDLLYARILKSKNHILWISPTLFPDLGGLEDEDYSLLNSNRNIEINRSSFHYNICVELELSHLDLNSIIQSEVIQEMEGIFQGGIRSNPLSDIQQHLSSNNRMLPQLVDENVLCADAFFCLRDMISGWFADMGSIEDPQTAEIVDDLRSNIYRWLQNSKALLHDPYLTNMVYNLMQKVFARLLITIRKLGISIIHATFNKLVLKTPKESIQDAIEHIQLLQNFVHKQRLFSWITIHPTRYWSHLLWVDGSNYSGILLHDGTEICSEPLVDGYWSIAKYASPKVGEYFTNLIQDYIFNIFKDELKFSRSIENKTVGIETISDDQQIEEHRSKFVQNYLFEQMKPNMKKVVNRLSNQTETDETIPLPGRRKGLSLDVRKNAGDALAFITSLCHVLSFNDYTEQEIIKLKENLLRKIGIENFSQASEFNNPIIRYTLPDVLCLSCAHSRNMDFCSDRMLLDNPKSAWECEACQHPYNKEIIEDRLIEDVHHILSMQETQDLKCVKCGKIRENNLQALCSCSGQYCNVHSHQEQLEILHGIAKYYHFDLLKEIIDFILQ